ncbi:SDR family oxidoreductase [Sulfitobacter delicatus]|uniref:NADP-dependent 3-hydroxy acid dehydrogenase YdfG n=1 Tax=Sulfitobacter delicatus TaxID=218672 RepID=A0A1G7Y883_9RHOB|nr:SDR family oxidoreductase [Sulfitobacter delicatus]SDG92675.1 NADP-dependent 3-hydroxy acid dehydrogenase YdfG [Sulfitobacter delicatus]
MDLTNKRILVTGGSDGIGKHICLKLAATGARLAILGRNAERLEAVAQACKEAGAPEALPLTCDLQDPAAISAVTADVLESFGGLDIVINNAGIWHKAGPLDTIAPEMLQATVQTNLTGLMQMTQALLPALRENDESIVLNVVSKSGVVAQVGQSVYTATKYGVRGFTEVLKADEAETGVRVGGLYQSGTNTEMFAKAGEDVPNHIFTEPDDLADVVVFVLSRPPKLWIHDIRIEL